VPLSLRRAVWVVLVGNAGYAAAQWLLLLALARLGGAVAVGQFGLGLAIATPIVLLTNLSLRAIQATDMRGDFQPGDYLAVRLVTSAIALATIAVVAFLYAGAALPVILLVGASKVVESYSDFGYGMFQQRERFDLVTRSLLLRGGAGLAVFAIALHQGAGLAAAVAMLTAVWLGVLFGHDLTLVRRLAGGAIAPRWDRASARRLLGMALPLGLSAALASLTANIPRYFVEHHLGTAELGVFVAFSSLALAVGTVITAIGQAATPRLATAWKDHDRALYRRTVAKVLAVGAGIGGAGVVFAATIGEWAMRAIFGAEFGGHGALLLLVMISAAVTTFASILGYAVTATRAFHLFLVPYAVNAVVVAAASALLVPAHGLVGAGWALVVGAGTTCLPPLVILAVLRRRHDDAARPPGGPV
jgi:O-antigen/teichoic acid export membrane protein